MDNYKTTFGDIKDYLQQAEIDEFGYHKPYVDKADYLHIYDNKNQVNIIDATDDISFCNIIFEDDSKLVKIFEVVNGIVDYNHPKATMKYSSNIQDWGDYKKFKKYGKRIYDILCHITNNPIKECSKMSSFEEKYSNILNYFRNSVLDDMRKYRDDLETFEGPRITNHSEVVDTLNRVIDNPQYLEDFKNTKLEVDDIKLFYTSITYSDMYTYNPITYYDWIMNIHTIFSRVDSDNRATNSFNEDFKNEYGFILDFFRKLYKYPISYLESPRSVTEEFFGNIYNPRNVNHMFHMIVDDCMIVSTFMDVAVSEDDVDLLRHHDEVFESRYKFNYLEWVVSIYSLYQTTFLVKDN